MHAYMMFKEVISYVCCLGSFFSKRCLAVGAAKTDSHRFTRFSEAWISPARQ